MKPFYNQTTDELLQSLDTSNQGLTKVAASERLAEYGPNSLEVKGEPLWRKLIEPFRSIFMLILFLAAGISYGTGETLDGNIILVIIGITAIIYYVQRFSTERVLKSLKKYEAASVEVWRDGKSIEIPTEDLVPGDVIRLYEGQKVPADARVIEADNVRCDEALLTGESAPVSKHIEALDGEKAVYEQHNLVFSGSFLVSGEATAVVTKTGNQTEFGKIAVLSSERERSSPVQEKIDKLIEQIVAVVAILAALLLVVSIYRDMDLAEAFHFIIALSVSVIPEGLPVAISVVLVFGMRRMARRKALVRNMSAIENIGLITTIASDKTGTLTKNLLEVSQVWHLDGEEHPKETAEVLLLSANQKEGVSHDPLDTAFTLYAEKQHAKIDGYEHEVSLPFDQVLAMSGNIWKKGGKHTVYIKGSPEKLIQNSTLSKDDTKKTQEQLKELTSQGLRVIALAKVENKKVKELAELEHEKLEFVALLAVADELRPEAKASIRAAQSAGVTVRMITGDHFETAYSIGKQLGLCEDRDQVFDSRQIKDMTDEELSETVAKSRVFARVIPEHKHRILSVLKEHDITAMTGDGVNDVPALTNAHIGLAMGSGSQIAQDAGDIILLDNNFKSIVAALEEGRKIFDNIRRMLFFLLTTSTGEALTFLSALLLGMPLPVLPVQILWINLVTDTAMVIPLGLEPGESDIMKRKPRSPKRPILGITVISSMVAVGLTMAIVTLSLFAYYNQYYSEEYARSVAFSALVVMQWAHAFNARSLWQSIFVRIRVMSKAFYVGLGIAFTVHMMAMYGPFQGLLSLEPISLLHFLETTGIAVLAVILAGELNKLVIRKLDANVR
jgi:P-type Ca2+ transporter type 2C